MKENFQKKKKREEKSKTAENIQILEYENVEEQEILNEREIIENLMKQSEALKTRIQSDDHKMKKLEKENKTLKSLGNLKKEDFEKIKNNIERQKELKNRIEKNTATYEKN